MERGEVKNPAPDPAGRRDLAGHLVLAAPVFLLYHLGLLASPQAHNGVDPITRLLGSLAAWSGVGYLAAVLVLTGVYLLVLRHLSRTGKFRVRRFPQVLLEAAVYAVIMGPLTSALLTRMHLLGEALRGMGPLDRLVASAGAGFYEELVFRLAGLGLVCGVLVARTRPGRRWLSWLVWLGVTSLVFSAMHYVGPGSDPWALGSCAFRFVLGCMLGGIFLLRGFATAVYAHFLYDVYVMLILNQG